MHRQLEHTAILLIEMMKAQLNEQNQTLAEITTKRKYLLKQITNLSNWIKDFDPQNINFNDLRAPRFLTEHDEVTMK